jgi:hypothetical protein
MQPTRGHDVRADAGQRWAAADYMFDIPVELAAALTGFRHDRAEFEWRRAHFAKLEPID